MVNTTGLKITHTVVKDTDIEKYLDKKDQVAFEDCVGQIQIGRALEGRGNSKYIVINTDEPYIEDVIEILKRNGNWG